MPAEQGVGPAPVPVAACWSQALPLQLGCVGPRGQVSSSSFSICVEEAQFMRFTLTLVCSFVF